MINDNNTVLIMLLNKMVYPPDLVVLFFVIFFHILPVLETRRKMVGKSLYDILALRTKDFHLIIILPDLRRFTLRYLMPEWESFRPDFRSA